MSLDMWLFQKNFADKNEVSCSNISHIWCLFAVCMWLSWNFQQTRMKISLFRVSGVSLHVIISNTSTEKNEISCFNISHIWCLLLLLGSKRKIWDRYYWYLCYSCLMSYLVLLSEMELSKKPLSPRGFMEGKKKGYVSHSGHSSFPY